MADAVKSKKLRKEDEGEAAADTAAYIKVVATILGEFEFEKELN